MKSAPIQVLDTSKVDSRSIIRKIVDTGLQEDAFYVCDLSDVVQKLKNWRRLMPRVDPYYAVKCNDNPEILKTLAALGTGFDCASANEIAKILSLGVRPSRIIYANPAKAPSHVKFASSNGVNLMTFDSEHELYKIKRTNPLAQMVLRIRSDACNASINLGAKFGCDPSDAEMLLKLAKQLEIEVVGVSFHVGSGCYEPQAYSTAIKRARDVFETGLDLGFEFSLLDIGGGYPGEKNTTIDEFAHEINSALDRYFPPYLNIKIISEPGRYFVSSAYTLACNIHSIKDLKSRQDGAVKHKMYYINDGTYGSFNILIFYDLQGIIPIPLLMQDSTKERQMIPSTFWGPTCDGIDIIVKDLHFPEMKMGEWVYFEDMGAYTLPLCSQFNGFMQPGVHVVINEEFYKDIKDKAPFGTGDFVAGDVKKYIRLGLD